jgi:hypothetical protein
VAFATLADMETRLCLNQPSPVIRWHRMGFELFFGNGKADSAKTVGEAAVPADWKREITSKDK